MRVIISAGGTGGHIYPALSILNKIKEKDPKSEVLYIGTTDRMEAKIVPEMNIPYEGVHVIGLKKDFTIFKSGFLFLKAIRRCKKIIKEFKPDVVIGVGGYITAPVIYSAKKLGIKTIIHEQNSIPGKSNTFLNKYDGSLVNGKPNNYFEDLEKIMVSLDNQEEKDIDEETYYKIGEHIENGIKGTARMLMTSGDKPVDMTVTDLQNIYTDTDNDAKLYGFISFRTLNYLRDVTMAYYLCFGKSGIESDIYRNSVDGLCGIGVKRDSKGEVKTTKIGKEFVDTMCQIVNDIEKMKNSKVKEYEKFFTEVLNPDKTGEAKKIRYTDPQLGAISNKLKELLNDKNLENVSRPIDGSVVATLCDNLDETTSRVSTKVSTSGNFLDSISADKFIADVITWNMIVDITTSIVTLVDSSKMDYFEDTKNKVRNFLMDIRPVGFKIKSVKKLVSQQDPTLGSTIPEIKSIEVK